MDKLTRSIGFGIESTPGTVAAWDDPPRVSPLADLRAVQRALSAHTLPMTHMYMTPATYRAVRHAARRGWWLTLPQRDKRWVRRHMKNWHLEQTS